MELLRWAEEHREERIDLLVSDVVMSEKNWPATFEAMEKIRPGIKVLFVTGYGGSAFTDFNFQPEPLLEKPVSHEDLDKRLEQLLR
jgi:two-component SAPR family response regulator